MSIFDGIMWMGASLAVSHAWLVTGGASFSGVAWQPPGCPFPPPPHSHRFTFTQFGKWFGKDFGSQALENNYAITSWQLISSLYFQKGLVSTGVFSLVWGQPFMTTLSYCWRSGALLVSSVNCEHGLRQLSRLRRWILNVSHWCEFSIGK